MKPETISDYGYTVTLSFPPRDQNPPQVEAFQAEMVRQYKFSQIQFSPKHDAVLLANPTGDVRDITRVQVTGNVIRVIKEPIKNGALEGSLQRFWEYLEPVLSTAVQKLGIDLMVQENVVRVLANPEAFSDAREFLGYGVCGFKTEKLNPFGRPVHAIGLRWYFPPRTQEESEFDVKIETLLKDPSLLFIENRGRFPEAIRRDGLKQVFNNLERTRTFIVKEIASFLVQFNEQGA